MLVWLCMSACLCLQFVFEQVMQWWDLPPMISHSHLSLSQRQHLSALQMEFTLSHWDSLVAIGRSNMHHTLWRISEQGSFDNDFSVLTLQKASVWSILHTRWVSHCVSILQTKWKRHKNILQSLLICRFHKRSSQWKTFAEGLVYKYRRLHQHQRLNGRLAYPDVVDSVL